MDEEHLIELNSAIFEEHLLHHTTGMLQIHAHDAYCLINPMGKLQSKQEVIEEVNALEITKLKVIHDKCIRQNQSAVLIGRLALQGTFNGTILPNEIRYMSVFIRAEKKWQLQARSLTPLP